MNNFKAIAITLAGGLLVAGTAAAAPAQEAIRACKTAVEDSVGNGQLARLTKVRARGANYEVWLNLSGDDTEQRSYCYLRRGEVDQLVVEDGQWIGRNPKRPEGANIG